MLMRSMPTARWIGASATISCMVEQLGLAMIPRGRWRAASGLTSDTTSGTSASPRNTEELSMTTAPAAANFGAYARGTLRPAEKRAMSTPVGSKVARASTTIWRAPNSTLPPAERSLARTCSLAMGNPRSARIFSMVSPTAPVAPTTATLYAVLLMDRILPVGLRRPGVWRFCGKPAREWGFRAEQRRGARATHAPLPDPGSFAAGRYRLPRGLRACGPLAGDFAVPLPAAAGAFAAAVPLRAGPLAPLAG